MQSPEDKILIRAQEVLSARPIHTNIGAPDPFNVRHTRNRKANPQEKPCISLQFIETSPAEGNNLYTADERAWKMDIDLIIDMDLATEVSGDDVTGLNVLSLVAGECVSALCEPDSLMLSLCDDVYDEGFGNDEDSTEDEGRLVQKISVLYRTPQGNRNVLLSPEENL